ncbi:MAG: hypothetical protein JWN76_2806 [Chitinophagaceae bacterium]|nr:hypothetical protein [Chitinophagaceae bacterium]
MNEKNILMLKARLEMLGFTQAIEERLLGFLWYQPVEFDLKFEHPTGKDRCSFIVHFARGEQGLYDVLFYTAIFKKEVVIPEHMRLVDDLMQTIEWTNLYTGAESTVAHDFFRPDKAIQAAAVFKQLSEMPGSEILKYKHWSNTPFEFLIPNLALLKSQYEIAQRFYLVEDHQPISSSEALRFLQSKTMEKTMLAAKKLQLKKKGDERTSLLPKKTGSGKLLSKRPRPGLRGGVQNE